MIFTGRGGKDKRPLTIKTTKATITYSKGEAIPDSLLPFVSDVDREFLAEPEKGYDATTAAEALATEHGIDLAGIRGTGAGGRITQEDVRGKIK